MKELTPEVIEALAGPVVEPCFLIEIELDDVMHLSTRQRFEYGGITYEPGLVQGLQISQSEASFGLVNKNFQHTTPALMGSYQRAPVKIWWTEGHEMSHLLVEEGYFDEGYYDPDNRASPTLLFQGNVTQFTQITSILGVVATRSAARHFPTKRVLPPIANFVRPEGTVIQFGNYTFRIDPRDF